MKNRMRAIVVQRLGPPEILELSEAPVPAPGPGQVLVRLHAVGVNFSDTERRRGVYPAFDLPWIPGTEGAGRVVAVGPDAELALLDRRVAFWAMPPAVSGTYAEYAVVPASGLFLLGPDTPFDVGAAFPQQGLTAYGLTFFATTIHPGAAVLIHAAAGGVGQILVQLVRREGARVFGSVSSPEKAAAVAVLGAEPLLYGEDLPERVAAATGGGAAWIASSIRSARRRRSRASRCWLPTASSSSSATRAVLQRRSIRIISTAGASKSAPSA